MFTLKTADLHPAFTQDRLSKVANWLLEEWRATEDDLVRDTDCPYTRGTTCFGRQKNRIISEYISGSHDWLGIQNGGLDLVFSIVGIPCRFSSDDPLAPSKKAVVEAHRFQMPLIEIGEPGQAVRFCFVVDREVDESSDARVEFLGFTAGGELVCRWQSSVAIRTLVDSALTLPAPVKIAKPVIGPKRHNEGDDAEAFAGQ